MRTKRPTKRVEGRGAKPRPSLAERVRTGTLRSYPDWAQYAVVTGEDLEVAVPAPDRSRAGSLVVFTAEGSSTWVRFAPQRTIYPIDSESELLKVIEDLLSDRVYFLVTSLNRAWVETTLIRAETTPSVPADHVAEVFSWSGSADRVIVARQGSTPRTRGA